MGHGHELVRGDVVVEHALAQRRVGLVFEVLEETANLGTVLFLGLWA